MYNSWDTIIPIVFLNKPHTPQSPSQPNTPKQYILTEVYSSLHPYSKTNRDEQFLAPSNNWTI